MPDPVVPSDPAPSRFHSALNWLLLICGLRRTPEAQARWDLMPRSLQWRVRIGLILGACLFVLVWKLNYR